MCLYISSFRLLTCFSWRFLHTLSTHLLICETFLETVSPDDWPPTSRPMASTTGCRLPRFVSLTSSEERLARGQLREDYTVGQHNIDIGVTCSRGRERDHELQILRTPSTTTTSRRNMSCLYEHGIWSREATTPSCRADLERRFFSSNTHKQLTLQLFVSPSKRGVL